MQENEELRSRLYDTHNTLAAAGGEGASEEHWRELAMSNPEPNPHPNPNPNP